ncbi:hypothetical protein FKW77_002835 [Venturia effusa]|uniref:Uncharacterized protein n=1 Tax=Venturia effusa TaxID=50376 RepID=A0A517LGS0_9PEZI|nr:hypothetical protein FKW77_002835 [Venturia effusa]
MATFTEPGNSVFLKNSQGNTQPSASRTTPLPRSNITLNTLGQPQQFTQQQLQHYQEHQRLYLQQNYPNMPLPPNTVLEALRVKDSNYTSKPIHYRTGYLHHHPASAQLFLHQSRLAAQLPQSQNLQINPLQNIAPELMEAIFRGDPGHFLVLQDGALYYMWRRTMLRRQGISVLTGQLHPQVRGFKFDWRAAPLPHPTPQMEHAIYAFFYYSWKKWARASIRAASGNNLGNPANPAQDPSPNEQVTPLEEFLENVQFYDEFEHSVANMSGPVGRRNLRSLVSTNALVHMDLTWQELVNTCNTGNISDSPYDRNDVISHIEAGSRSWADPNWLPSVDYTRSPRQLRTFTCTPELLPYIAWATKEVLQREQIVGNMLERERVTQHASIISPSPDPWKDHRGLRPATQEEASYMDQFLKFDDCEASNGGREKESSKQGRNDSPIDMETELLSHMDEDWVVL